MLDEQSFQGLLAAAFTIQEHNALRKKNLPPPETRCRRCGAPTVDPAPICSQCSEQPRQGEELQRKWASLWMMSQEQGLGPENFSTASSEVAERTVGRREGVAETVTAELSGHPFSEAVDFPNSIEIPLPDDDVATPDDSAIVPAWADSAALVLGEEDGGAELAAELESQALETVDAAAAAPSLRDWRLRLRFHRADFYLVAAVAVATVAMVWVLSATPAVGAQRKPKLRPWERAMISLGLAEAPEPPPRRGNPNISVWVDPKTALYYCVGEELYGKAPGGHLATQREAQLDQFEPAGRAACE